MTQSLKDYKEYGSRSNRKLYAPHGWIAKSVIAELGNEFQASAFGIKDDKEKKVSGKYHDKQVDIAIEKIDSDYKARIIAVASFKFVTSNYKQNSINYFENLLGETANIRRAKVGFAHLLVLRNQMPYFTKDGDSTHQEKITEHKYIRLFNDKDSPHKPEVLGIALLDFNGDGKARFCNLRKDFDFSEETIAVLEKYLSVDNFIEKFTHLCRSRS